MASFLHRSPVDPVAGAAATARQQALDNELAALTKSLEECRARIIESSQANESLHQKKVELEFDNQSSMSKISHLTIKHQHENSTTGFRVPWWLSLIILVAAYVYARYWL